jgi:hypothetical protein
MMSLGCFESSYACLDAKRLKKYGNLYNWVVASNLDRLKPELSKMGMSESQIKEFLKY